MIGQTISHYKILEKIGEGGMGIVYKAEDTKLRRPVALKVLPRQALITEEDKTRFAREAQAAASLSHPNIAVIHEFDEVDDPVTGGKLAFIAMEFVDGETVKEKTKDRPLPIDEAIKIAVATAEGLAEAHGKGIIHRDIKSENIMISRSGVVKIMDFGLAEVAGRTRVTKEGMTVGTAAYMSPEQALGEKLDQRTDIWSLGVVMYEMITGRLPFAGDYEQAIVYRILNEEPEPITSLRSNVPMELERILRKTMHKDRVARYQSVGDLLVDLQSLRKDMEVGPSRPKSIRIPAWKRKSAFLYLGLSALVVVTVVTMYFLWSRKPTLPERISLAVLPFSNTLHDTESDFLGFALADQIIGDLSYLKSFLVRPSTSIRRYQGQAVDPNRAGQELDVDYILSGSYLKQANRIRLNAELINVHNGEMIWREPTEVEYQDAFKLQDIVSEKVIHRLEADFSRVEYNRRRKDVPKDPIAYEYYLRAISFPFTNDGSRLAQQILESSIRLDSTYAPAFAEMGFRSRILGTYGGAGRAQMERAEQNLRKALALNQTLLPAIGNLASLYAETGRSEASLRLLQRGVEINPNDAYTRFCLSYLYRYTGMLAESEREADLALTLDPRNPRFRSTGRTYVYIGKYDKALKAFDLDPRSPFSLTNKAELFLRLGKSEQAVVHYDSSLAITREGASHWFAVFYLSYIKGRRAEAKEAARELERLDPGDGEQWYSIAILYGLLGEGVDCARVLRKAVDSGFFSYPYMQKDAFLDPVRNETEMKEVFSLASKKFEDFKRLLSPPM